MRPLIERAAGETIRLGITAEPGLWPCNVDRAQLEAAVLNLALNARDAMPDGGALAISVGNIGIGAGDAAALDLPPGQFVQLTVADTGSGMTAEVAARAFEPFYSTKEVGKGSGLGLSQVYGFSRQSGGTTLIESEPGAGTTVSLFLPRAPEVVAAAVAPPAAVSRTDARHSVLVVEDEPGVLALLEESLSDLGYRVLAARDAAAALAILRSDAAIDLLFSDIILPGGMTGIELARQARRLRQDLKVLLSSGYPGDKWAQHGSAGEFEVLGKPFRQSDLTARIGAILATERR
jgi:CheY-like chemotaxis protein